MSEISRDAKTSESDFRVKMDAVLSRYFIIYPEVTQNNGRLRIDYILKCRKSGLLLGMEVKRPNLTNQQKKGRDWGLFLNQAVKYSKQIWNIPHHHPQRVPVFIYPPVSKYFIEVDLSRNVLNYESWEYYPAKHKAEHSHTNVNSLISTVTGVGELRTFPCENDYRGNNRGANFGFYFNNFEIWHSYRGMHKKNYNQMVIKM
jgi:hypothetical protein